MHSARSQLHQRREAYVSDQTKLSALCLLAQMWLSHSLYLSQHTATPSYLSALLFLLPAACLHLLARLIATACGHRTCPIDALLPPWLSWFFRIAIALSLLVDAVFLLCGASSLLNEMLPTVRRYVIVPFLCCVCLGALVRNTSDAAFRLAGYLFFPLLIALMLSISPALPQGDRHHFFPALGNGFPSILEGALFLTGSAGCACLPLLLPDPTPAHARQAKPHIRTALILLLGGLMGALVMALYSFLLPAHMLTDSLSMGRRLLLPVQVSSSVPGWSLYVSTLVLLLIIAYTGLISRCKVFLAAPSRIAQPPSAILLLVLIALTAIAAFFYSHRIQSLLVTLLPWRFLPYAAAILCCLPKAIRTIQKRRAAA